VLIHKSTLLSAMLVLASLDPRAEQARKTDTRPLRANIATIVRDNQCITFFAGVSEPKVTNGHSRPGDGLEVQLTLAPGCEQGIAAIRTGVWPQFAESLRYGFAISSGDKNHEAITPVHFELIQDYSPTWSETHSVRTLSFKSSYVPGNHKETLIISVFTGETKLAEMKVQINP
jgi:hypothetical protein